MKRLATSLAIGVALCVAALAPAQAEMDIARLKAAIETSFEADYPRLDALYRISTPTPSLLSRRSRPLQNSPPRCARWVSR
jgi:hippurate hydrolase